jgi:hypothetical protein
MDLDRIGVVHDTSMYQRAGVVCSIPEQGCRFRVNAPDLSYRYSTGNGKKQGGTLSRLLFEPLYYYYIYNDESFVVVIQGDDLPFFSVRLPPMFLNSHKASIK